VPDDQDMQATEDVRLAAEGEHVAPSFKGEGFHCMHCGVLAQQSWQQLRYGAGGPGGTHYDPHWRCVCRNCRNVSWWNQITETCIEPLIGGGPRPHIEMPEEVREDYEEARRIVGQSPRGACALLRLAVQKLCLHLEAGGGDLNDDIKKLVENGMPVEVQEALDSLRVIGNEAVHPGEMDLKDDVGTASNLFNLLNFVVDDRIAQPKKRKAIFAMLPQSKRDGIKQRDGS